ARGGVVDTRQCAGCDLNDGQCGIVIRQRTWLRRIPRTTVITRRGLERPTLGASHQGVDHAASFPSPQGRLNYSSTAEISAVDRYGRVAPLAAPIRTDIDEGLRFDDPLPGLTGSSCHPRVAEA